MLSKLEKWVRKGLLTKICNGEELLIWLFNRFNSEFANLFDPRYQNSIELSSVCTCKLHENIYEDENIDLIKLSLEDAKKLPHEELKVGLKRFYEEILFDSTLDYTDFYEACISYKITEEEVLGYIPESTTNLTTSELTHSGHAQLIIVFN